MRFVSLFTLSLLLTTALASACASSEEPDADTDQESDAGPDRAGGSSGAASSGGRTPRDAGPDARPARDGGPTPGNDTCENELELYEACGFDQSVQCGLDGYVVNCRDNETAVDSAQRKAARAACLGLANCEPEARQDCIYRTYNDSALSAAQSALLTHYCAVCEPGNETACAEARLHYDPEAGIGSTDSVFLAVWELSPALVQAIDEQCVDSAAVGDAGTCYSRFDSCAGGPYVDALVDCAD